jgi:hypothetical protein
MKNSILINANNAIKNALTITALFALLLVGSNAKANDGGGKTNNPSVEIKYLGTVDYKPIFKVEFEAEDIEDLYLSLKDENGNTFYSEAVKEKKYSKKFQFDNMDVDGMSFTVILRSKKGTRAQVFEINKNVRQVEDIVIAKIQ